MGVSEPSICATVPTLIHCRPQETAEAAGAGFVARIEGDDLRQPPKVLIRQLPDDTGTLAADREPHEHASDRDPGLVPRPLQQLSLCYANLCAARLREWGVLRWAT